MIPISETILYLTPAAYSRLGINAEELKELGIEVCVSSYVYMNMMDGWTRDECDRVVYLMPKSSLTYLSFRID